MARLRFRAIKKRERNKVIVELIDKLLAYGRVINGVALAEGLVKGAIKESKIAEELLNFRRDFNIASMKLAADFVSELYSSDPCASDGKPCENLEVIGEGAEKLAKVGVNLKTDYGKILVDWGVLDSFLRLKLAYETVGEKKSEAKKLIQRLKNRNVATDDEKRTLMSSIDYIISELKKIKKMCEEKLKLVNIEVLTQENYLKEVEKILGFEAVGAFLKKESVEPLKEKLTSILKLAKQLKPKLSKENLSTMKRNLKQLFHVVNSPRLPADEKSLTSAFYSGHSDFARLTKDVEDLFESNIGLNGSSKQKLHELFSSLKTLNKNVEPVVKALQNNQSMVGVEENVMKDFEDAEKEVEMIEKTQPFLDCVENMSGLDVEQDITEWGKEKKNGAEIEDSAKEFLKKIRDEPFDLSNSTNFWNSIRNDDNLIAYDNLQKSTDVDNVIKELEGIENILQQLEKMPISKWAKPTDLPNLIEKSKKWLSDEKFISGLSCAQNKTVLDPVIKNFAKRAQLSAVTMLNAKNQHDAKLKVAANTLRSVTKEYESFLSRIKTKKVRSAERIPTLEEGLKICQNLSAALKIYRDLIYAYASNKDIQELLKIEAQIESKIAQLTDPDQKKKVKSLWNEETKKTLASIPGIIDQLSKKITNIPKTLTEFGDILKSPVNLEALKSVDLPNLIDTIQSMDANLMDQGVADRLRTVQMDFANGNSKMKHGLAAFLLSVPWFNSLTAPSQAASADGSSSKDESTSTITGIVGGIVAFILLLLFAVYIQGVVEIWKEDTYEEKSEDKSKDKSKVKSEEKSEDKSKDKSKVKSEEKSEDKSKDKSKVKSEEKSTETSGEKKKKKRGISKRHFIQGFGKLGSRLTCGAFCRKKGYKPLPTYDEAKANMPKVEKQKVEITKKLDTTKVFKDHKGGYYVVPKSNAANFKNDLRLVEEGKVDPTQDTEVDMTTCEVEVKKKLEKAMTRAENFANDQNLLRAGYRREPDARKAVIFKNRSKEQYERMRKWEDPSNDADDKLVLRVEQPKEIYYVGEKYDIFKNETAVEAVEKATIIKAELKSEKTQKTYRPHTEGDAKLLTEKSFKDVSTRVMKARSTLSIDKTQDDQEENQEEHRAPGGREDAPDGHKYEAYCVKNIERAFSPTIAQVLEFRGESRDNANTANLVPGEYYIKKYKPELLKDGKIDPIDLQKLMLTREIVHYAKNLEGRGENHLKLPIVSLKYMLELVNKVKKLFHDEHALLELKRTLIRTIGDLHGNHDDMARHMEIGIDDTNSTFLFLGDYVDRGHYSLHVVLHLCLLKLSNPRRYYFLRGNHEFAAINVSSFLVECVETYGYDDGTKLWRAINAMFDEMPVAAITQGSIWNAHGGISGLMLQGREWLKKNLKKKPENKMQWQLLIDIMWNDPIERFHLTMSLDEMFPESDRTKYAHLFTQNALQEVLEKCEFDAMFRGHQVKLDGFEQFCNLKCFTIFGACNNTMNNFASQALVHRTGKVEFVLFRGHDNLNPEKEEKTICDKSTTDRGTKNSSNPTEESKESKSKSKSTGGSVSKNKKLRPNAKKPTTEGTDPVTRANDRTNKGTANSNMPAKTK